MSTQDPIEPARANPQQHPARKLVSVGGVALIALAIALLVALRQGPSVAAPDSVAMAQGAPERTPTAAARDPLTVPSTNSPTAAPASSWQRAGALRRQAFIACKTEQWAQCGTELDEAARLDPDGERAPAIQRMHDKVERGLHGDALSKAH